MEEHDQEGRLITLEFDSFFLSNVYTPTPGASSPRLPHEMG